MNNDALNCLPSGYILKGKSYKYEIKDILEKGSFGITYLAKTYFEVNGPLGKIRTKTFVTVKEFFMSDINGRNEASVTTAGKENTLFNNYKNKFKQEAKNLSESKHRNIVNILEYFETNNTVYYVMEYLSNGSIDDLIEKKGKLSEDETIRYTKQICEALQYMHSRQILHLDLKPKNIMLNNDNEAILIDFGLSKLYDEQGNPESSTNIGSGTPGYSPLEQAQYEQDGTFQATLDIYALGATMYKMLTGERPYEASKILNDGFNSELLEANGVSNHIIGVIEKAMMPIRRMRFQSIAELNAALTDSNSNSNAAQQKEPDIVSDTQADKSLAAEEENDKTKIQEPVMVTKPEDLKVNEPQKINHTHETEKPEQNNNLRQSYTDEPKSRPIVVRLPDDPIKTKKIKKKDRTDGLEDYQKELLKKENPNLKRIFKNILIILISGVITSAAVVFFIYREKEIKKANKENKVADKLNRYTEVWDLADGRSRVFSAGKGYGFIDENQNEVIPLIYEEAWDFEAGLSAVKKDDKWGYINTDGEEVISFRYDKAILFTIIVHLS